MPKAEQILRAAYGAFKARDLEAALELTHEEVDWPTAREGAPVVGRLLEVGLVVRMDLLEVPSEQ
jgi:hypothetical protein